MIVDFYLKYLQIDWIEHLGYLSILTKWALLDRNSSDNVRRLINIIWSVWDSNDPTAAISLDAEKAFDRLEWRYMFQTLKAFGFGQTFLRWIDILYKDPEAAVRTNGLISSYSILGRGTGRALHCHRDFSV